MATCLLYLHRPQRRDRYYRIDLALNLFGEFTLFREWGVKGEYGRTSQAIYDSLREASVAADIHRARMIEHGYNRKL